MLKQQKKGFCVKGYYLLFACMPTIFSGVRAFRVVGILHKIGFEKLNRTVVRFSDFTTENNIKYVVGKASTSSTIAALENALKIGNEYILTLR